MPQKIIVIIPTYNESANIKIIIQRIFKVNNMADILIVDDNSPDGTAAIVKKLQKKYSNIYLINRPKKLGLASAYRYGFSYALNNGYDIIIQMDGDLSHSPEYLIAMLSLLKSSDLVIGSRYVKGGGVSNWSLLRLMLSRLANFFAKMLLNVPINDLTSGFKCVKKEVLQKINFSTIKAEGYAFQIEMVYRAYIKNVKIKEYPIIFRGRERGKSNMSFEIIIEAFIRLVMLTVNRLFI